MNNRMDRRSVCALFMPRPRYHWVIAEPAKTDEPRPPHDLPIPRTTYLASAASRLLRTDEFPKSRTLEGLLPMRLAGNNDSFLGSAS